MAFLQGTQVVPAVLKPGLTLPSGQYYVDVVVNNENTGKTRLTITPEEEKAGMLSLSPEWLKNAGVPVRLDNYASEFSAQAGCYQLARDPYTRVDFNYGNQALIFSIPQVNIIGRTDPSQWDYGVNAFRLQYQGNMITQNNNGTSASGSADLSVNLGRWVVSSSMNGSRNTDGRTDFAVRDATLISGVATSTSRITITQNGYTMYSRVVQPGPYELNDVRPVGNGDLEVTVEDANGRKTVTRYPVTTLPTLLRPGELQYDLSVGRKTSGSVAYGLGSTTLSSATIMHNKYRAGGVNLTQSLGAFGALSFGGALSRAEYDNGQTKRGHSISAKYAKSFADTTNLHLMAYHYQSRGYVEFADFDPTDRYTRYNQKSRYEMQLTQRLPGSVSLGLTGWREDYWNQPGQSVGVNMNTGFSLSDDVSVMVNAGYSRYPYRSRDDYSGSLMVSIPFTVAGGRHYSSSSVGYSRYGGTQFQTSASASPNERMSYNVTAQASDKGACSASASLNYGFDAVQTNIGISQGRGSTSLNAGFSGSVVATAESGLLLTRNQSSTMGMVQVPGVAGVRFNNSPETNSRGYTVVSLSDYSQNRIDINMENVPDNLELDVTSYSVVPTEKAVVYREFGANYVKRYFLQMKDRQGRLLSGGDAKTEQGLDAGFIARNGVLSMSLLSEPKEVKVSLGGGKTCRIPMGSIKPGTEKVQEVYCE